MSSRPSSAPPGPPGGGGGPGAPGPPGEKPKRVRLPPQLAKAKRGIVASGATSAGGFTQQELLEKRNEERPCPYCDRLFKQLDRLKMHIKNQHSDEAVEADVAGATASSSAVQAAAIAASSAAPPAPARPATASGSGGGGGGGGGGSSGPEIIVRASQKLPKVILQEWLQKHGRPGARYKCTDGPEHLGYTCKVVLPDKIKPSEDIVLFTQERAPTKAEAEHRAAVMALHRVAAALPLHRLLPGAYADLWHKVQVDEKEREERRAREAEREAARRRREAAMAKKKELPAVYMSEEKRRLVEGALAELWASSGGGPGGGFGGGGGGMGGGGFGVFDGTEGGGGEEEEGGSEEGERADGGAAAAAEVAALTSRLTSLGFGAADAAPAAARAVSAGGRAYEAALDELLMSVPESRLPQRFAPTAKMNPVAVIRPAPVAGPDVSDSWEDADAALSAGGASAAGDGSGSEAAGLAWLAARGYAAEASRAALRSAGGELPRAHEGLFRALLLDVPGGSRWKAWPDFPKGMGAVALDLDSKGIWEEECVALEAIFGAEASFPSPEEAYVEVAIEGLPASGPGPGGSGRGGSSGRGGGSGGAGGGGAGAGPVTAVLEVRLPQERSFYPVAPPLLAVRTCPPGALPAAALRRVTAALAGQAAEMAAAGAGPMVHALAGALPDLMTEAARDAASSAAAAAGASGGGAAGAGAAAGASAGGDGGIPRPRPASAVPSLVGPGGGHPPPPQAGGGRHRGPRQAPRPEEIAAESDRLLAAAEKLRARAGQPGSDAWRMAGARGALPAAAARPAVLTALANHRVVVISGETGCGKSTQVPQFILEEAIDARAGGRTSLIVTQPRRVAAIGLAERVAAERGERPGESVGYAIRGESAQSARTRLLFCTAGVLLRRLLSEPSLPGTTHVIIDEVHERTVESDLLLLLLRDTLTAPRPPAAASGGGGGITLVLMSATADAALFADYFERVGLPTTALMIPGFTHPVREYYLEDIFEMTGFRVGKGSRWAKSSKGRPAAVEAAALPPAREEAPAPAPAAKAAPAAKRVAAAPASIEEPLESWEDAAADDAPAPAGGKPAAAGRKGAKKGVAANGGGAGKPAAAPADSWEDGDDDASAAPGPSTRSQSSGRGGSSAAGASARGAAAGDEDADVDAGLDETEEEEEEEGAMETGDAFQETFEDGGGRESEEEDDDLGARQGQGAGLMARTGSTSALAPGGSGAGEGAAAGARGARGPLGGAPRASETPAGPVRAGPTPAEMAATEELRRYDETVRRSVFTVDESLINNDLIEMLLVNILRREAADGLGAFVGAAGEAAARAAGGGREAVAAAVLVFLPGTGEIGQLQRQLERSRRLQEAAADAAAASGSGGAEGGGSALWVLPLHGMLSAADQARVFQRPPAGTRKIVLATNVAETSVTIDDVLYVIDSGRHKEMRHDASRGLASLEDAWVSAASARQRRGRAGRVRPGACFRLFSRLTLARMEPQQAPEVLRVPLEQLCLRVKATLPGPAAAALASLLSPPSSLAVTKALAVLRSLGALDGEERLTPLGQHLVRLPLDVRAGKMLIFGVLLRCLDPVLTIAAAMAGRPPFLNPPGAREEAERARRELAGDSRSDHLALVAAYNGWRRARARGGYSAERGYCDQHFLSQSALQALETTRGDYAEALAEVGLVPHGYVAALRRGARAGGGRDGGPPEYSGPGGPAGGLDANATAGRVVKAVLCAGFYPNVLRVQHPETVYAETVGGALEKEADPSKLRFYARDCGRVFLHPASTNFAVGKFPSQWLVYSQRVRTDNGRAMPRISVRESSMVPLYSLLLFGGDLAVDAERARVTVDRWIEFAAPARIGVLIRELRAAVDRLLAAKVHAPGLDISASPAVGAMLQLLTTDGF